MCFEINKFCVIMPKIVLLYARALITNQVSAIGIGMASATVKISHKAFGMSLYCPKISKSGSKIFVFGGVLLFIKDLVKIQSSEYSIIFFYSFVRGFV